MRAKKLICGAVLGVVVGSAPIASAAVISGAMHEPFSTTDYPVDPYTMVNTPVSPIQNSGQGWNTLGQSSTSNNTASTWGGVLNSGTDRTVNSPGLTFASTGYLASSGNKLTLNAASGTGGTSHNIGRTLGGQSIDSGVTYFSSLISQNTAGTTRTINVAFLNDTNERFAVGQIGATTGNTGGNIGLLMNNSNPAGLVTPASGAIAMGVGVTHLIVGRIDWNAAGNETVSIWVDPSNVTNEAAAGPIYVATSGFELINLTRVRPFVGNNATGFPAVSANFDEIRLGGTWESVTSLPVPQTVPEPASFAVVAAISSLGLLRRRHAK